MAQTSKKRARQLKQDRFRDTTITALDRLGDRLEGRGRTILYVLGGLLVAALLAGIFSWWQGQRADEARAALGRAIELAEAPVSPSPQPGAAVTFPTERERAQKALEEFQKVAGKYGDPYNEIARFMAATQLLTVERARGLSELETLSKSGDAEIAARSKFALAQAREADGQYDGAATLYNDLLKQNGSSVAADSVNLRLASVYEKQGKRAEAADILFRMVETARKAKEKDGTPAPESQTVREAADKLKSLDPARHEKLPPAAFGQS